MHSDDQSENLSDKRKRSNITVDMNMRPIYQDTIHIAIFVYALHQFVSLFLDEIIWRYDIEDHG